MVAVHDEADLEWQLGLRLVDLRRGNRSREYENFNLGFSFQKEQGI